MFTRCAYHMQQVELTTKLVLAIIGLTSVGAVLIPTYAVPTIRSGDIFDGEVKTADLANNAVTTPKIADNAVTSGKISNTDGVRSSDIVNGEVKAEDIAAGVIPSGNTQLGRYIVSESTTLDPNHGAVFGAECEEGDLLTGGGFFGVEGATEIVSSQPSPFDPQVWLVDALNRGSVSFTATASAVCLDLTP